VTERVQRLYRGEFEALFRETLVAAAAPDDLQGGGHADNKAQRAVELAHLGNVSKALSALTSGGVLPLEEAAVREAFTALLQPERAEPPPEWREFVRNGGGDLPPPNSDTYKFELGECEVVGADGLPTTVDTLQHALYSLDPAAAAGVSALALSDLRRMSPDVVRPLLRVYFGHGTWNYAKRVDGHADGARYHADTHALLISVRPVALDKDGSGFVRGRPVRNIRPIGIGEALRRLAGKCQLLQLGTVVGAGLARNGQFGAGFKNGTDMVYHTVSKCVDAMVAAEVAGGASQTDARNAFCSMYRRAIQRGIAKHARRLLPTFDFLYWPNATGSCYCYGAGGTRPLGSCLLLDGVQQGDVFGPLFFSLGLDELLDAIRARMRNLHVDSTMLNKTVHVIGPINGVHAATGVAVLISDDVPLTLVAAPSFTQVDLAEAEARDSMRVTICVGVGAADIPASFEATVP